MDIPKKITLAGFDVVRAKFELPNGKIIVLRRGETYETSDPEELDFFSTQRVVNIRKPEGKELEKYISQQLLPTVDNLTITAEMVDEFKWSTEAEERVIAKLIERGYKVEEPDITYKVVEANKVKLKDSEEFLPVDTVIDTNKAYNKTIAQMLGYGWIK